jgi:hypothetical protein
MQVVEIAQRPDARRLLSGLPVATTEDAEVDASSAPVREQDLVP